MKERMENGGEYVRITSGKYKGCIGKIVYEYKYFKGLYLVEIVHNPRKTIYDWNPTKEIVVTGNSISKLPPDETIFIESSSK